MTRALLAGLVSRGSPWAPEDLGIPFNSDPALEARPKTPALPAPAAKPVSSQAISEAWGQELARRQATPEQADRPAGQDL